MKNIPTDRLRSLLASVLLGFVSTTALIGSVLASEPRVLSPGQGTERGARPDHVADRVPIDFNAGLLHRRGDSVLAADLGMGQELQFLDGSVEGTGRQFVWRGRVRDRHGQESSVTLTVMDNRVSGSFQIEGDQFVLSTSRDGEVWLDRIDQRQLPPQHPVGGPLVEPLSFSDLENRVDLAGPRVQQDSADSLFMDVLVFYTDEAHQNLGDFDDEAALRLAIHNAVDRMNTAFRRNDIDSRVRLVGLFPATWAQQATAHDNIYYLRDEEFADELRERYSASFVSVVTANSEYCGLGYQASYYSADYPNPYSWVSGRCIRGRSLAHELGHNMGLHHDDGDAPREDIQWAVEPFAWGHYIRHEFRTIMGTSGSCRAHCRALNLYSDPDVIDSRTEQPVGVPDLSDNAEVIRRYAPLVENWRSQPSSIGKALGLSEGTFDTQGSSYWVAQDNQRRNDSPTMLSGPVFGNEYAELVWQSNHSFDTTLLFAAKAWEGPAQGVLRVQGDGETLNTIEGLADNWQEVRVDVPAGTEKVTWVWDANGVDNVWAAGQAMVTDVRTAPALRTMAGQVQNHRGEPVSSVVVAVTAETDASEILGEATTDGNGGFTLEAHQVPDPPAYYQFSGDGVEADTVSLETSGCDGTDLNCALPVTGVERSLSGQLINAEVADETLELVLMSSGSRSRLSTTVTMDGEGRGEFAFTGLDALYHWGPLRVATPGYEHVELTSGLNVRGSDVTGLSVDLTPPEPEQPETQQPEPEPPEQPETEQSETEQPAWVSGCSVGTTHSGFDPVMPLLLLGGLLGLFRKKPAQPPRCTLNEPA